MHERTGAIARTLLLVSQPQVAPVAMKLWLEITKNHLKNPSKEIAKTQNVTTLIHNFLLRKSNLLDQQEATVTLPVPCLQRFRRRFHPLPLKGSAYPWWFANTIQLITDRKKSTKSNLEAFYLNLAFRGIADACWQSTNYPRVFRTFAEIQMECQHIASGGATGHAWPTKQHNIRVRGLQTWEILALHLVIYIYIYIYKSMIGLRERVMFQATRLVMLRNFVQFDSRNSAGQSLPGGAATTIDTECNDSNHQTLLNTWWLIPLSKWVITPVISGLTLLIPFITGVITHLLSGMSHQVLICFTCWPCFLLSEKLRQNIWQNQAITLTYTKLI